MLRSLARIAVKRRAFALVAMVLLVWCQIVAVGHATTIAGMAESSEPSVEMSAMVGCDGLMDAAGDNASDCPSEGATSDFAKQPVFAALPPAAAFALMRMSEHGVAELVRYQLPQGRAPPRTRLCSWLM